MFDLDLDLDKNFPQHFDNFTLSTYQECPKKFQYRILKGLTPHKQARSLDFGIALHLGLATWYENDPFRKGSLSKDSILKAIKALTEEKELQKRFILPDPDPAGHYNELRGELAVRNALGSLPDLHIVDSDDRRTHGLLEALLRGYFFKYPVESFVPVIIEQNFDFALPDGNIYTGIIDLAVKDNDTQLVFPVEHKTTSSLYYFGEKFNPNQQVSGYVRALKYLLVTERIADFAIINGILVSRAKDITIKPADFGRFEIKRPKPLLDEFELDAIATIDDMKADLAKGFFRKNTTSCHKFGGCPYRRICNAVPGLEREAVVQTYYEIKPWSTRGRDEIAGEDAV